jgi:CRP-like cAMP-binding protein
MSLCATCAERGLSLCGSLLGEFGQQLQKHKLSFAPIYHIVPPRRNIYVAGEASEDAYVMCSGWACRLVRLPDGRRQILSFLLPGDLFAATAPFQQSLDFYVEAITEVRYAAISRTVIREKLAEDPLLLESFVKICIAEIKDADETLTDLGQRSADEHIARLILQLMERLSARGMVHDQSFEFPLRQQHIADAVGLTPVHVSRVMSTFRHAGLIEIEEGVLKILDLAKLRRVCDMK